MGQASDKFADIKEQTSEKVGNFTDKLKGMASDLLEKGADAAHNLADKLKD